LCGATWPKEQTERVWFSSPTCPTCKRLKKNGEQAKRGGRK
jgi:thioredoxin-related protein